MAITPVYLDFANGSLEEIPTNDVVIGVVPVNYVVMNTDNSDPATYMGYGTWTSLGNNTIGATTVYYYKRTG
jgi:hypothetical protein